MKKYDFVKKILKWLNHYFIFFLLVAFVITCCTMLFVSIMANSLDIVLSEENISAAAKITFWNVALLSFLFTVIDSFRRKLTVERPMKRITDAAEKIIKGDFSVRIKSQSKFGCDDSFNQVIDCFNKMAEELGSVETLRTDFIANVSHEMKTPLAVMQNYGTLLQNPDLVGRIVKEVVKNTNKPVTVKMRKGWDKDNINAVEIAKIIENAGASAIIVHGRTREEYYSRACRFRYYKRSKRKCKYSCYRKWRYKNSN